MKYEAPDDLEAATLAELREAAEWVRDLDIAVQVELSRRSKDLVQAQRAERMAAMSPKVRKAVSLLEGYGAMGTGKRSKWTLLWLAALTALAINARRCSETVLDLAARTQEQRELLQAAPVEVLR